MRQLRSNNREEQAHKVYVEIDKFDGSKRLKDLTDIIGGETKREIGDKEPMIRNRSVCVGIDFDTR